MAPPTLEDPLPFYRTVWLIVRQIPHGQVSTYGQIASMIPPPDGIAPDEYAAYGAQIVGYAMNAVSSRDDPEVPWHRVINSKGGIAMSDTNPSAAIQRGRLRAEGVIFNAKELIDLSQFGWAGPDPAWIAAHDLLTPRPLGKAGQKPPAAAQDDDPDDESPTQLSLF
ncbi:MAG: MGMT family protein [bacterium]|nr:MGMT family protein [bacterium]